MPKKIGNGGHGQEEYSSETGRYIADGQPNKYYNNEKENKVLSTLGLDTKDLKKQDSVLKSMGLGDEFSSYNDEKKITQEDIMDIIPEGRVFVANIKDRMSFLRRWEYIYKNATMKNDQENFTPVKDTFLIDTPERNDFRKRSVNQEIEKQSNESPKKYERKAVLVLGQPASGKSFATKKFLKQNGAFEVDGDIFTHKIPEFKADERNVSAVHEEAMQMSKDMLNKITDAGANFVIGKIGGGSYKKFQKMLDNLSEKGYTVEVVFGDIPVEKSLQRNLDRHLRGEPRLVPPSVPIICELNLFSNLAEILNHPVVVGGEIYNNDVQWGEKPKLLKKFAKRGKR